MKEDKNNENKVATCTSTFQDSATCTNTLSDALTDVAKHIDGHVNYALDTTRPYVENTPHMMLGKLLSQNLAEPLFHKLMEIKEAVNSGAAATTIIFLLDQTMADLSEIEGLSVSEPELQQTEPKPQTPAPPSGM